MKTPRCRLFPGAVTIALLLALPFLLSGRVIAQENDSGGQDSRPNEQNMNRPDADLIGRLNLTPDQIRQIREIRQQSADELRIARQRVGRAQFALDESIYADSVDETAIEVRAKEFAVAQAAVIRLRAQMELRVRRVLTPDQLQLLRVIRQEARDRGRTRQRNLRQNNPSAFQERQRRNLRGNNPNGAKPAAPQTQPPTTARPGKP